MSVIFKCKMCGGDLDVKEGSTIAECLYCGRKQTLPKLDDDKRRNLYDRATYFRQNGDFDKAMTIYEQILSEDNTDAEAYWSLVLCRYGVEYVEDPLTHQRVPTVNRTQPVPVTSDEGLFTMQMIIRLRFKKKKQRPLMKFKKIFSKFHGTKKLLMFSFVIKKATITDNARLIQF